MARRWLFVACVSCETRRDARVFMGHPSVEEKVVEGKSSPLWRESTGECLPRQAWSVTKVFLHTEVALPVQLFTEAERARHNRFPETMASDDLVAFVPRSDSASDSLPRASAAHTR
jgi:hypothetical protein